MREIPSNEQLITNWKSNLDDQHHRFALESHSVHIPSLSFVMPHDKHTFEHAEAIREKLKRQSRLQTNRASNWDADIEMMIGQHDGGEQLIGGGASKQARTLSLRRSKSQILNTPPRKQFHSATVPHSPRMMLQRKWNQIIEDAGAASITLVNDIDSTEIPDLPAGFQYIESSYE
jgi:hypothetical protein